MLRKKKIKTLDALVFHNKFGIVKASPEHTIYFPKGLIGMSESKTFCLAYPPDDKFKCFKLLQSTESEQLCFLTLPIASDNKIIKTKDLQDAISSLALEMKNTAVLLICSTKKIDDEVKIVVNARAPVFIDVLNKTATQYILYNSEYSLTHVL